MLFQLALITSLKILFMYGAMQEGMFLFWLRRCIDKVINLLPIQLALWIRKPLYSCLFCMSSIWGFIFTIHLASFTWEYLEFLMIIAGINYIIQFLITTEDGEEIETQDN